MASSTSEHPVLDQKDRRILDLVQRDGRMPQAEIARQVQLSTAAVNERIRTSPRNGTVTTR